MSKNNRHKVLSGALQFTIFISVLVALLLAGVLLLFYSHNFFTMQSRTTVESLQLAAQKSVAFPDGFTPGTDTLEIISEHRSKGVKIVANLSRWGVFEKTYVKVTHRKKEVIDIALKGSLLSMNERPSLYLSDHNTPLSLAGNAHVEGRAYLPMAQVRPGNITGHGYYGIELIHGEVKESTGKLPELKYHYLSLLKYYIEDFYPAEKGYIGLESGSRIVNSFTLPTKGYFSSEEIILSDVIITGNIVIRSSKKIIIDKSAKLTDVILAAPEIIVNDGVKGNFQAIADTVLKVGQDCNLIYPSALILVQKNNEEKPTEQLYNKILVGSNSKIRGSILYLKNDSGTTNYPVNIYLDPSSKVKGEVYCQGNLELRGEVRGSVYTDRLLTTERGTKYLNHLYNATITTVDFPAEFGGILLQDEPKTIIKWLY